MAGKLFIISAPSGAGKTSLIAATLKRLQNRWPIERVVTYTTKEPRNNEQDGIDYHFISPADFQKRIDHGFFLEWSTAYQTSYGSPRSIMNERGSGRSFILIIDRVGAERVKEQVDDAILIWIAAPSFKELERRLRHRATENPEQIDRRLKRARVEIELEIENSLYDFTIINDDFMVAQQELEQLIAKKLAE